MDIPNSSHNAGFIFVRHIRAAGFCTIGSRRFLLDQGMSNAEIQDFFNHGMSTERFEQLFGQDAMARQVIERAKQDGQQESTDDRL
ncbi:hypothetical protein F975_01753 [Acinetobacter sp. ANC 3789]|uniref:hypothetical protein n=1 Tax=Acinetobacter sp. ANC 3789 TaxID=1217714 RepID=UPI0002CE8017|nr:hypothetical protein [Acinetobacter sp. ANC 3789]ENU80001.1 hypothetical protein F975_01753 [Acinetobacter sp. ANC 3789]